MRYHPILMLGSHGIHQCMYNNSEHCYGEPLPIGLRKLVMEWPREVALDEHSVFYDVGSGFGRLSAFIRLNTNVSAVRGIEINRCRHDGAVALLQTLHREAPLAGARLEFVAGDVRTLGIAGATHLSSRHRPAGAKLS